MKIFLVARVYSSGEGGMLTHIRKIAKHLNRNGHEIILYAPVASENDFDYDFKHDYKIVRLKKINFKYLNRVIEYFDLLRSILREKPDILIMNEWAPYSIFFTITKLVFPFLLKTKISCFAHGSEILILQKDYGKMERFYSLLARFSLKYIDKIFAVSTYTKNLLINLKVDEGKIAIIKNGIDLEDFENNYLDKDKFSENINIPNISEKFIISTVSKLVERKGHETVLKALSQLQNEEIYYFIVGDGPYKEELVKMVKELKLEKQVYFLGKITNELLPSIYKYSHIFIMPSYEDTKTADVEGFGIVFLEANLSSTIAIGANSGGIPDVIKDEVNGYLIEPKNEKQLSVYISQLFNNKHNLYEFENKAYEYVKQNFTWDKIIKTLIIELEHLLKN